MRIAAEIITGATPGEKVASYMAIPLGEELDSLDGATLDLIQTLSNVDGENYSDHLLLWDIHAIVNHWSELTEAGA